MHVVIVLSLWLKGKNICILISSTSNNKCRLAGVQHQGVSYVWGDNEAELLVNITLKCKVNKIPENASDASRLQSSGREDVYLSAHILKGPNWHYFGSVCQLSTVDAGDKVAFKHCRQSMISNKRDKSIKKTVSWGERLSFLKIFFPSFPKDFFKSLKT